MELNAVALRSVLWCLALFAVSRSTLAEGIRLRDQILDPPTTSQQTLRTAFFALGSFWHSEAAFSCLPGVVRTSVGYAGGSKANPEYRNLGDHAECVRVEYNPKLIQFKDLLNVFWDSHDSRQVFGQGPDVGNQYRSIIFTNGTQEARIAAASKDSEQAKSRSAVVTTEIQQMGMFYLAEAEHQKFELRRHGFLMQLIGSMSDEELIESSLAAQLNGYAAELCPSHIQRKISDKIDEILKNGWPVLRKI